MEIGLIDVDGHNFPNLALMRISAYHKAKGDNVNWWWGMDHYNIVYESKIFSGAYSTAAPDPFNTDKLIKGGTGWAIDLVNGKEVFNKEIHKDLPQEIEKMFPDYSIYPQYDFAIAMTSRGCPRGCEFCHVAAKEGKKSIKVADVSDFYCGQKEIEVCDPNIMACQDKKELLQQYKETKAIINFNQGLDMRLITGDDIEVFNNMRLKNIHFAWDNPKDNLKRKFELWAKEYKPKVKSNHGNKGVVYCLVNFNSTMEENLYRIYTLRDIGLDPFVMVYNKPEASKEIRQLQRWVNNKFIFYKVKTFEEYKRG